MNPAAFDAWAFPPEPSSSREARRRVSTALESRNLDDVGATVSLVVSELATNAVLHARTPFEVRVLVRERMVRIEVQDRTGHRPDRRYFSNQTTSGRGLRLVEELCESWGVDPDADGAGKTVWAEVAVGDGPQVGASFDLESVEEP